MSAFERADAMSAFTGAENLVAYLRDWERRYGCPAPTAALAHDLELSADRLALLLARLECAGIVRRVGGSL